MMMCMCESIAVCEQNGNAKVDIWNNVWSKGSYLLLAP